MNAHQRRVLGWIVVVAILVGVVVGVLSSSWRNCGLAIGGILVVVFLSGWPPPSEPNDQQDHMLENPSRRG